MHVIITFIGFKITFSNISSHNTPLLISRVFEAISDPGFKRVNVLIKKISTPRNSYQGGSSRGYIFIDQYWLNKDSSYKEIYILEGGLTPYLILESNEYQPKYAHICVKSIQNLKQDFWISTFCKV